MIEPLYELAHKKGSYVCNSSNHLAQFRIGATDMRVLTEAFSRTPYLRAAKALARLRLSQLAFYVNLHRAIIGPSATLTGR